MQDFFFASTPHIHFGPGIRRQLPKILASYGRRVLLVSGGASFDASPMCQQLWQDLQASFELRRIRVSGEPSPQLVDQAVREHKDFAPHVVLAIGGGSAVDAGKAIAGLIMRGDSVMEYLEGVGKGQTYQGPSAPFVAVPTTAGTGGETSKNAVLSDIGPEGYKKSFRDEQLVARSILLDPELTLGCPPALTAACGMDAFTQLLESYVSTHANPMTDALALSGLGHIRDSLLAAVQDGENLQARSGMLYASAISGLTLANAGLGSVHGLASPLGAYFPIPHGVVCGTLLYEATRLNIALLEKQKSHPSLEKYAEAGRVMLKDSQLNAQDACNGLLMLLSDWTERLSMPRLSDYGISHSDIPRIVASSRGNSMKTNPVVLSDEEIAGLVQARL